MKRTMTLFLLLAVLLLVALPVMAQDGSSNSGGVLTLDTGDVVSIVVGLIGLVGSIIAVVVTAMRTGKSADAGAVAEIEKRQMNREWMERNERAYQEASAERKELYSLVTGILGFIAPITTGIKADDAALKLLQDIQTPGPAPVSPPVAAQSGAAG